MNHLTKNAIAWNRNAVRRAVSRLQRARTDEDRQAATRDIHRFEDNIEQLKAQAAA